MVILRDLASRLPRLLALPCLLGLAATAHADPCRLETAEDVETIRRLVRPGDTLVCTCADCRDPEPLPLHVRSVSFDHHEPERVREAFGDATYPLEWLERAERTGDGPLVDALMARITAEQAASGGYPPGDPWLVVERRQRLAMLLLTMREDHDLRTWDALRINGEPADPTHLYYPIGGEAHGSLGALVGCDLPEGAPATVRFSPPVRNPATEAPPSPLVVDVTGRCYDGSCPSDEWTALEPTALRTDPDDGAIVVATLERDERVRPLRVESHVVPARAVVTRDHGAFLTGDVIHVLDSLGEGAHRVWRHGETHEVDVSDVVFGDDWAWCREQGTCWARAEGRARETWWAEVRRRDGSTGWVRVPLQSFAGVLTE